jgi:putative transposase
MKNKDDQMLLNEEFNKRWEDMKSMDDVQNLIKDMVGPALEKIMDAEMDNHLGYTKHDPIGYGSGNNRNGHSEKTLKSSSGMARIKVPRDRNSSFEPEVLKKYETHTSEIEDKIISMYAKGMSTRDIDTHMYDIYGAHFSPSAVSHVTDKVMPLVEEFQARPLECIYPFVFMDGIHFKVRTDGKVVTRCAYVVQAIKLTGHKEILGIYLGEAESAKFWLGVLNDLKNRGVHDILIASVDGLPGFKEALEASFPKTEMQRCIVHQIRNTLKYIPHKDKKAFVAELKNVYKAVNEKEALKALDELEKSWPKYLAATKSWRNNWTELATFFQYPAVIRTIMYTTNSIESLNRGLRKVTKTTSIFPTEQSLMKLLFLSQRDITKKWDKAMSGWGEILSNLTIHFEGRLKI